MTQNVVESRLTFISRKKKSDEQMDLHSENTLNLYIFFFVTKQMVDFHITGLVHRDVL